MPEPRKVSRWAAAGQGAVLFIWLIAGSYAGMAAFTAGKTLERAAQPAPAAGNTAAASYQFHGINFRDAESFIEFLRERRSARLHPWVFELAEDQIFLLTVLSFGLLGGCIRVLRSWALDRQPIVALPVISAPLFGALTGPLVCLLAILTPAMLRSGVTVARPEALAGLALLGGAFSETAHAWIEAQAKRIFDTKSAPSGGAR